MTAKDGRLDRCRDRVYCHEDGIELGSASRVLVSRLSVVVSVVLLEIPDIFPQQMLLNSSFTYRSSEISL